MKITKSWFSLLSLALLFTFSAFANPSFAPENGEPSSITKQVHAYLQSIDLTELDEEKTVLVDFMLNAKGELMILSTNDKSMDKAIKSKLNYKTITDHKLAINTTYTLPILFRVE